MTADYIPPYPARPKRPMHPLHGLLRARKNLLGIWHEGAFEKYMLPVKLPGRRIMVVNRAHHIRRIFLDNHDNYDPKSPQMRKALAPLLGDGLFVSDGDVWRRRRAMVAPAIAAAQLPNYAPLMVDCALETVERWQALGPGADIDALSEMAVLTARIIGRTVFGDGVSEEEAARVVSGFSDYQAVIEQMDLLMMLGGPKWLSSPSPGRRAERAAKTVQDMVDLILTRAGADKDNMRLAASLLAAAEGVEEDPAAAVRNEAIVLFMAGHETTANALAWTWSLLAACPDVEEKLFREVSGVLDGRPPTLADFNKLPYTRAVFEETLRLYPPVPLLSREARGPDQLGSFEIRGGDIIVVAPWLVQRHKGYWRDPDVFRPERFLPGPTAEKPPKFAYLPFSGGARVCLGARFGLVEAVLCLATLAQRFRLVTEPGYRPEIECRLTLRPKGGLPMRLEPRA